MEQQKMVLHAIMLLVLVWTMHCYPNPKKLNSRSLDVSSAQEVNSLEQEEPIRRSINLQRNRVEDTIKEVENLIKSDPSLPRLTRGEILDLVENITKTDAQTLQILPKTRDSKAIMVVMPYKPDNDNNMEDLYTKPPVTHIIQAEPFKNKEEVQKPKPSRRRPSVNVNEHAQKADGTKTNQVTTRPASEIVPTTYHPKTRSTTYYPTTSTSTRRPVRRKTTTTEFPRYSNHRYPDPLTPGGGIRIIDSPNLNNLQHQVDKKAVVTKKPLKTTTKPSVNPALTDINFPENLKNVMKDLNLEQALNPIPEVEKTPSDEQNKIKDMLASIGVITTTTTTLMPDAENVAESLSPEMRELLMSFGLLPNPNEKPVVLDEGDKYIPDKADVKPESYNGFKPLPDDGPGRDDMDALLASFGLGRSARKQKSVPINIDKEIYTIDMIPDDLKGVVSDFGIQVNREEKKIDSPSLQKNTEKHVFTPDTQYATEEELKKLEKLMSLIKQLEAINGTTTDEDLKKINLQDLKELVGSLNSSNNATFVTLDEKEINSPDPNDFDVGISKNEVKRQQENTTTSTEESQTPALSDLEASFGGQADTATAPPIPATTTKRTGFYYLVDWNTFLDIDDMKGKRVNLRFQPTIGDPKNFRSVSVP